jgi:hypothetical protein
VPIYLDTRGTGDNTRVVEDAIRRRVKDDPDRARFPDVVFNVPPFEGTVIEVKQTTSGFGKIPTDTYGLANNTAKWYIFLKGRVTRKKRNYFDAWIMRADHLHNAVAPLVATLNVNVITPGSQNSITSIAQEITTMASNLATIIDDRAQGGHMKPPPGSMSLPSRVGLNRVRFDIKFESLLRKTITEMLKD